MAGGARGRPREPGTAWAKPWPQRTFRRRHAVVESSPASDELTIEEPADALTAQENTITELKETVTTQKALIEQLRSSTEK